jgi:hypothetical protein
MLVALHVGPCCVIRLSTVWCIRYLKGLTVNTHDPRSARVASERIKLFRDTQSCELGADAAESVSATDSIEQMLIPQAANVRFEAAISAPSLLPNGADSGCSVIRV